MPPRIRALPFALAACLAGVGVLIAFAAAGWPGAPNTCAQQMHPVCFCERLRIGWVAQPANTFSNLGFMVVGLSIAVVVDRRLWPWDSRVNLLTATRLYPVLFAVVTALLGPGSMALHASMTRWGGMVDVASMYLYASLLVSYGATRLVELGTGASTTLFIGLFGALVTAQIALEPSVEVTFGLLLAGVVPIELAIGRRRPACSIERRWAALALLLFGAAFAVWLPSLSGGPWCVPDSWLQGHAVWHVLCAAAAGAMFLYYGSEDDPRLRPGVAAHE